MHEDSKWLNVASVDCADGPEGRNKLCDEHGAFSLPTLKYYLPHDKKGDVYEGNRTAADLKKFATELAKLAAGVCSVDNGERCTDSQKGALDEISSMSTKKIKASVKAQDQKVLRSPWPAP